MHVSDLPRTPATHFKLFLYAVVLQCIEQIGLLLGSREKALEHFPFLANYLAEVVRYGAPVDALEWAAQLSTWEDGVDEHLPLRALRHAGGHDQRDLLILMSIGLSEEDARFGLLFEQLLGLPGQHRPTVACLESWWGPGVRGRLAVLERDGMLRVLNGDVPYAEAEVRPDQLLWSALRGDVPPDITPPARLVALEQLILPENLRNAILRLPDALGSGDAGGVVVRGPRNNGRRTLVGGLARALGRRLLESNVERWQTIGPAATALHALPMLVLDLLPGETVEVAAPRAYEGPVAIVLGHEGGVSGAGAARCISLDLAPPDATARSRHWQAALGPATSVDVGVLSERFLLTGGSIRRLAGLARAQATLDGRPGYISPDQVQIAARALDRAGLDTLATRVTADGDWCHLVVAPDVESELRLLRARCLARETLPDGLGPALSGQFNRGVRALFSGPSGTGKTLAARLLAASIGKDLYRLDLSAIVNKYIGETEKNLHRVFQRAEELDVILLLDEGDALLTQRTAVQSSNDRYANLETNYLLQRLESFEGILIVTSNASQRIDAAFQRRMDIVIEFRPPDAAERWHIWQLQLPVHHCIDSGFLEEVAGRCVLNGGQIRNASVFAALLALDEHGSSVVDTRHLEAAVRREYRKVGAACPLRASSLPSGLAP